MRGFIVRLINLDPSNTNNVDFYLNYELTHKKDNFMCKLFSHHYYVIKQDNKIHVIELNVFEWLSKNFKKRANKNEYFIGKCIGDLILSSVERITNIEEIKQVLPLSSPIPVSPSPTLVSPPSAPVSVSSESIQELEENKRYIKIKHPYIKPFFYLAKTSNRGEDSKKTSLIEQLPENEYKQLPEVDCFVCTSSFGTRLEVPSDDEKVIKNLIEKGKKVGIIVFYPDRKTDLEKFNPDIAGLKPENVVNIKYDGSKIKSLIK